MYCRLIKFPSHYKMQHSCTYHAYIHIYLYDLKIRTWFSYRCSSHNVLINVIIWWLLCLPLYLSQISDRTWRWLLRLFNLGLHQRAKINHSKGNFCTWCFTAKFAYSSNHQRSGSLLKSKVKIFSLKYC